MRKTFIALLLIITAGICSCGKNIPVNRYTVYEYFDTVTEITAYGEDEQIFKANCQAVRALMEEYHRLLDIYYPHADINNLYTVNKNAGKSPVKADKRLIEILKYGKEMYTLTNGNVNIAMGAVTSIWHEYRTEGVALPERPLLEEAALHCDINDIIIDEQAGTVYLADKDMSIDIGALGKGYTCQKAIELLRELGAEGYAVNMGGNICVTGKKQNGEWWTAGIQSPFEKDGYVKTVYMQYSALVTSGSYMRYYTVDGVKYHHIINPKTLYPSTEIASVSVLCDNAALGDALSTALFNMSVEEGMRLVEGLQDVYALWVDKDGKVYTSRGFDKYIKQ